MKEMDEFKKAVEVLEETQQATIKAEVVASSDLKEAARALIASLYVSLEGRAFYILRDEIGKFSMDTYADRVKAIRADGEKS